MPSSWVGHPLCSRPLDPKSTQSHTLLVTGTDMMRAQVRNIIDAELAKGIELSRIVVGGFSMGAAQSLHMLSDPELCAKLAGVFAMSTFLPDDSVLPDRVARHTSAETAASRSWDLPQVATRYCSKQR